MSPMTGKYAEFRCPRCFAPPYRVCRDEAGRTAAIHPERKRKQVAAAQGKPVKAKRRKQRPRQPVSVRQLKRTVPRQKAGKPMFREIGKTFDVTVRDKRGRRRTWRSGLPWNEAQRLAANARRANYRDVRIKRVERTVSSEGRKLEEAAQAEWRANQ